MTSTSSSLARLAKRTATEAWSIAFGIAGSMDRSATPRWTSGGDERVLVLAPHPDDEVAGCGGAVLLHRRHGDHVVLCFAGDGSRSRALGLPPPRMAEVRRAEGFAAARSLDVQSVEWLGLPEGDWAVSELASRIRPLLEALEPTLVYAPSRVDYHTEHWRVAAGLASALSGRADVGPRIRADQVQVPLTPVLTNLVAPIDDVVEALRDASACYRSQRASLERCWRMKRYAAARHGTGVWAEPFWELPAESYVELHPASLEESARAFQGLWHLPFKDPVAYASGVGRRRKMRVETSA